MKEHNEYSISPNELILVDNSCRLREFRTRTILREEFGKKVIRKFAMTEEAKAFLKAIVARERENVRYLRNHFDILCGNFKGDYIEYEYVPYESLFEKIASKLRENCCIEADELLRMYVQKVHALPKVRIHPKDFLFFITHGRRKCGTLAYNCLSRGLLDLIPRNIMLNGDKWLLIDNEWSFDFPVPVVFVVFRAIRELVIELQDEIRRTTTRSRPAIGVFARGLNTHYMPKDWIKYIVDSHVSFSEMLKWEMGFQRYVTGLSSVPVGHIKTNPRNRTLFSASHLGSNSGIVQVVIRSLKRLPIMRRLLYLFECMILRLQK
jgi:hypothetical protein